MSLHTTSKSFSFPFLFFPVQLAKQKPVFKYLPAPSISTASHLRAVVSLICSPGETTAYKQHANPSIYQHLKSVKSVFHLNPESLFFPFPETLETTDHTHTDGHTHPHARYPVMSRVTHVPHRGESSVLRANRLIMMPIHYQELQRPCHCFPFIH